MRMKNLRMKQGPTKKLMKNCNSNSNMLSTPRIAANFQTAIVFSSMKGWRMTNKKVGMTLAVSRTMMRRKKMASLIQA